MAFEYLSVTVASAGTAQPLSLTSLGALSATIRAKPGNTGRVFLGGSTVGNTLGGLEPGAAFPLFADYPMHSGIDLSTVYANAATTGDGFDVWYVTL